MHSGISLNNNIGFKQQSKLPGQRMVISFNSEVFSLFFFLPLAPGSPLINFQQEYSAFTAA